LLSNGQMTVYIIWNILLEGLRILGIPSPHQLEHDTSGKSAPHLQTPKSIHANRRSTLLHATYRLCIHTFESVYPVRNGDVHFFSKTVQLLEENCFCRQAASLSGAGETQPAEQAVLRRHRRRAPSREEEYRYRTRWPERLRAKRQQRPRFGISLRWSGGL